MPTTNARKHTIPSGSEQSFSRGTLFSAFGNSIRDIVPVANVTERAQLVTDLTAVNQAPSATKPLVVLRADAPGVHRIEYTINGTVWLPASGTLFFASKAAADSFATSNGGLLSVNDECRVGSTRYLWSGTKWVPSFAAIKVRRAAAQTIANAAWTALSWDTEDFDIGDFRGAGAPTDLIAPVTGIYHVDSTAGFALAHNGRVGIRFLKNGAEEPGGNMAMAAGADDISAQASTLLSMNAGDVLRVQIFQSSGSAKDTSLSSYTQPTAALQLMATT